MVLVTNFGTSSDVGSALRYGSNESKLGYTIPLNCSKDNAGRDFKSSQIINNHENDKVKLHRFVLSFANDKRGKSELNQPDSGEYVRKFMNNLSDHLDNNASMIAYEHLDREHNHYHIYINSVGLDGNKINPKESIFYLSRHINDDLANDYKLKPIQDYRQYAKKQFTPENRAHFAEKHNGEEPYSYYDDARQKISRAALKSHNLYEFHQLMITQDCGIEPNFFKDTKTGSVDIQYRHKNWDLDDNRIRKVRTRTLGSDFEKSSIKQAIANTSHDSPFMRRYELYSQKKKSVQGGKMSNIDESLKNKDELRGVPYYDKRLNFIKEVKGNSGRIIGNSGRVGGNSRRINSNSRRIKGSSIKIGNQESDHKQHAPKVKKAPRPSQSPVIKPNLNGLSQKEREQVIEYEKFINSLFGLLDELTDSFQSILIRRNKPKKHHRDTFSSFKRKLNEKNRIDSEKLARQRKEDRQFNEVNQVNNSNHIMSNSERKRYNKLNPNTNKRKGPHYH